MIEPKVKKILNAYSKSKDKDSMLGFIKSMIAFKIKFDKDYSKDISKDKQLKVLKESLKEIEKYESKTKEL